jgi:hypothetical protein
MLVYPPSLQVSGWWNLEKPETKKQKARGEIHLTMTLSTEKDQQLTSQEHRHLLKILFAYELQRTNAMPFTWNGDFSRESVLILAQVKQMVCCSRSQSSYCI